MTSLKINAITSDSSLSINSNIVPTYSYPVSNVGAIGYTFKLTQVLGQTTLTSGSPFTIVLEQAFTAGTWLITGSYRLTATATTSANISLNISKVLATVPTTICISSYSIIPSTALAIYPNISLIYQADGIQTVSMILTPTISASTVIYNGQSSINYLYATRIG